MPDLRVEEPSQASIADADAYEGISAEARLNRYRLFDQVNGPYLRWQLEQFEPWLGQRLLEIGCGVGGILSQLKPREFVMGVDIEVDLVEFATRRFVGTGNHEFAALDISKLSAMDRAELKKRRFDTVLSINVLEHVKDDASAISAITDVVAPGGSIAILVPAHPSLFGPYDAMEGHFRRYSKPALRDLLVHSGLEIVSLRRFNMAGALGWWVQYRLLRQRIHRQGHFKVLQSVLPVLRFFESRVEPPIGLSLIAVARKPDRVV